jgi:hypothetical protein
VEDGGSQVWSEGGLWKEQRQRRYLRLPTYLPEELYTLE